MGCGNVIPTMVRKSMTGIAALKTNITSRFVPLSPSAPKRLTRKPTATTPKTGATVVRRVVTCERLYVADEVFVVVAPGYPPGVCWLPCDRTVSCVMSERILVTGATGPVGSEVIRLLTEAGAEVKAGTRRPDRATGLAEQGVEVVELDYYEPATFDAAVEWADRVFLQPPPFAPDAYEMLVPLLDWAVQARTGHVVTMSAMGMEVRDDLPIRRLEKHVEASGVDYTILRPNFFMQNFGQGFLGDRVRDSGQFAMPVEDARVSIVDGRDVAAVAAACLTTNDHFGRAYTLTGPGALTHSEIAQAIAGATGRSITFEPATDEEMLQWLTGAGWRPDVAGVVIALYQSVRAGVRADVTGDVEAVLGRSPTAFGDFVGLLADEWS
jgi:uncharacterized protein YbjT (DUF2867 family)